jgi:hypothetical protein
MGSSSSGVSYPRTPSDASLPIHALLSNKAGPLGPGYGSPPQPFYGHGAPAPLSEQRLPFPQMPPGPPAQSMSNGEWCCRATLGESAVSRRFQVTFLRHL